ncbi:N-acetyltryptophan 6-hydroxylase ivoC [Physcia stellaris]|nr:N-acetyltryptophan 6-hydroxylase ivoC [Physcia stellaris]
MIELLTLQNALLLGCVYLLYGLGLGIYRLYFDPLAKFPGPKLAALTLWYEFYYDVVKRGRYTFEIAELHKQYGPIIRINPYELHISDPDYYDSLYVGASVRRTERYPRVARMFGKATSTLATISHDLHRVRRSAIAPFLSKQSVQRLEPTVQSVVSQLTARLQALQGTGQCVDLIDAFAALAGDIISQYAFAKPYGLLQDEEFAPWRHKAWMDVSENGHMFKQFAWLEPMLRGVPRWAVRLLSPQTMSLIDLQDAFEQQVIEVQDNLKAGRKNEGQRTVFYDVLTNEGIRPEEKSTEHLKSEAQLFVSAGTVTTSHVLSTTSFHLVDNPEILERLQQELEPLMSAESRPPTWQQLEQLPYLTAVINEGLRISYGVITRLQRISPDVALQFHEWTIPPGTPVSMSAFLMHNNPTIFPNPRSFSPERWLQPSSSQLHKHIVPFSRGSRGLAYCELYLTLAAVFAPGRFHLKLFETDITDVETPHDFMTPCQRAGSKGIRVIVV